MKRTFKTEYEMLVWYDNFRSEMFVSRFFLTISDAFRNETAVYLDLKLVINDVKQDLNCLEIRQAFQTLYDLSENQLTYDKDGFHLPDHTFETLKEVRKALKNKAFL